MFNKKALAFHLWKQLAHTLPAIVSLESHSAFVPGPSSSQEAPFTQTMAEPRLPKGKQEVSNSFVEFLSGLPNLFPLFLSSADIFPSNIKLWYPKDERTGEQEGLRMQEQKKTDPYHTHPPTLPV